MEHTHCPTCGRKFTQKQVPAAVSTADMTDAQVYTHFKKTARAEDLSFFLRVPSLSQALRAQGEAITRPTQADMTRLHARWRMERQAFELTNGIPAIGSWAWVEALNAQNESEAA